MCPWVQPRAPSTSPQPSTPRAGRLCPCCAVTNTHGEQGLRHVEGGGQEH